MVIHDFRCACTGACGSVVCIQTGVLSTMHAQVFTSNSCCVHERTHLRTRLLQDVAYALMNVQFVHLELEKEGGGV